MFSRLLLTLGQQASGLRLYRRPSADGLEGLTKPGRLNQNHPELAEVAPAQCGVNRPSFPFRVVLFVLFYSCIIFAKHNVPRYLPLSLPLIPPIYLWFQQHPRVAPRERRNIFTIVYIYRVNFTRSCCSTSTLYIMYFPVNTYQYIRAILCQELRPV
jgi:hypothetical protein